MTELVIFQATSHQQETLSSDTVIETVSSINLLQEPDIIALSAHTVRFTSFSNDVTM